mmetsp:Transcript_9233/g.16188  ORF Transcript_9233/g.16188 Transcript_9233/m.16188 type:complete len:104 (-) Transcript_9233:48-359(-)
MAQTPVISPAARMLSKNFTQAASAKFDINNGTPNVKNQKALIQSSSHLRTQNWRNGILARSKSNALSTPTSISVHIKKLRHIKQTVKAVTVPKRATSSLGASS